MNRTGIYISCAVLAFVLLFTIVTFFKKYWSDQLYKLSLIEKRSLDPFKKLNIFDQREKRMKRIKPLLENLAKRMEENNIGSKKVKNDILRIPEEESTQFHSQALRGLFNALDKDDDGYLSYNDFNILLGMNQVQLEQFVEGMNWKAGLDPEFKLLPRSVFVRHFLSMLEKFSHLTPTEEDAKALFHEMAKWERENNKSILNRPFQDRGKNDKHTDDDIVEIRFETFREEDFFHFLSQQQTNDLMKRFRWLRPNKPDNTNGKATSGDLPAPNGNRRSLATFGREAPARTPIGSGFSRGEQSTRDGLTIGRDEFIKNYPKLLKEVVSTNAPRRESRQDIGIDAEQFLTIDIAFENLALSVELANKKAYIVDHVTGRLRAQTMTALMGGSGM